jgi:predicted nucleic acid-binding protein
MGDAVFVYYLDASVFVKLAVDEPGSHSVRGFFNSTPNACITTVSFIEALGVLKRNWEKKWKDPNYHRVVKHLVQLVYGGKPIIDDVSLAIPSVFNDVSNIAMNLNLDFADALQLFAILNGKYSHFVNSSQTHFITADKKLAIAARSYGIRTWRCSKDKNPEWV